MIFWFYFQYDDAGLLFVTLPELSEKSLLFPARFFILSPNPNSTKYFQP